MSMKKKKLFGILVLASTAALFAACTTGGNEETKGSAGASQEEATERPIKLSVPTEVASLDTAIATDMVSFGVLNQIYEGLYRVDETNTAQPAGAADLAEVSEDGLTYTIKLREDAKWSNGDPVVAGDYVYAWQRLIKPETASEYAYLFEPVLNAADITAGKKDATELGIEAISDYELKITLAVATPYFDSLLAFPSFFPANQKAIEEFGNDFATTSEAAYYNGPFTLSEFDGPGSDTEWTYVKNDTYWDKDSVKTDQIDVLVIKEASTGLNLFQDGQLDDAIITGELAQQFREDESYTPDKIGRTIYVEMNQKLEDQPFGNANFRKALSYVVDNEVVATNILGDGSTPSTGIVPTELASNPETKKDFAAESGVHKSFDVEKAKEYLEKAKKELNQDSFKFEILTDDNEATKKIAEYLQGTFKENLGVETTVTPVTKPIRLERTGRDKSDFEMVVTAWGADYADPSSFLDLFATDSPYNRGFYSNEAYDKLIKEAATTLATKPAERWATFLEAEKLLLADDAAVIPVYQLTEGHLRNQDMKGYIAHSAGAPYEYKYIYLEK